MKKIMFAASMAMLIQSCFPSFESTSKDKLFIKEIQDKSVRLEWFFYSTVTSATPDYLTIQKGIQIDTICIANNIANLKLEGHKIIIGFYGGPQKYMKPIKLPKIVMGYQVIPDSSYIKTNPTDPRKFYKKK